MIKAKRRQLVGNGGEVPRDSTTASIASFPSTFSGASTLADPGGEGVLSDEDGHLLPTHTARRDFEFKQDVWTQAYERLKIGSPDLLASLEAILIEDGDLSSDIPDRLSIVVSRKRDEMLSRTWTLRFRNHRLKIREQIQRIARVAEYTKSFGSVIANVDPLHAGLPWAGINLLLTVRHFFNVCCSTITQRSAQSVPQSSTAAFRGIMFHHESMICGVLTSQAASIE